MGQTESKPDASLIDRCAAECLERGWRLAWLMLLHREDASDAVQQAFIVAINKRHRIPRDDPWPWLAAVIAREARYIRRKRRRHATGDPAMPVEDSKAEGPLAALINREQEDQLARALDELPPEEREALVVTKLGGLTYAEAAQALSVPPGTLNHRISRALDRLRRNLREEDEPAVARTLALMPVIAVPDELRNAVNATALNVSAGVGSVVVLGGIAVKKTTALIVAVLMVLLLGAGAVVVMIEPSGGEHSPQIASQDAAEDKPAGLPQNAPPESDQPAAPPDGDLAVAGDSDSPGDVADSEPVPERRVLMLKDPDGNPVSLKVTVDWRESTEDEWTTQHVTTDGDGRAELDAPREAMLRLNLDETSWVLGWRNFLIKGGEAEATVTAYALKPLQVKITYADGKPFTGHVRVKAERLWEAGLTLWDSTSMGATVPAGWPHRGDRVTGLSAGAINFEGLPTGIEYSLIATSDRAGYAEATRVVSPAEVSAGELIEIVVPEGVSASTPGKIVLVSNDGETIDGKCCLFKVESDGSRRASAWNSRDPLESGKVWAGRYVLIILGAMAWQSEEFDLAPGETVELRPVLSAAASLSARVVDENGEPVRDAAIAFATQELPRTIRYAREGVRTAYSGEALTDEKGRLEFSGLPPGTFEFQIYARGMQPWVGHATMVSGQVCDLGDIRLEIAKGKVEVRLPDWDFATRRLTWTLSDSDYKAVDHGDVESSILVLDRLPVGRTYRVQISIRTDRGSRAFWYIKPFDLTLAVPTQEFDGTDKEWPANLD